MWKESFPEENRYYETENGILYNADATQLLKKFPESSVDLLLTDPPYMISKKGKKITRTQKFYKWKRRNDIGLDFGEWDRQWKTIDDYIKWTEEWFSECVRILKEKAWLYIFSGKEKTGIYDLILGPKYGIKSKTIFTWIKTNPVPSFRKINWISGTEFIWVGSKGESKIKNFLKQKEMYNYFISPNASAYKETEHPTEKPLSLIQKLILVNSDLQELVLDPFIGSGTTAVVCEQVNRRWIGIEMKEEFCEMTKERLKNKSYLIY